jgi:hypothetical protein
MIKKIVPFLLALLLVSACKNAQKTATGSTGSSDIIRDGSFRKPINDKALYNATTEVIPIDTVYIEKDTLNIITKKLRGCDAANFKLMWNGDLGKSVPAQTGVKLFQLVDGSCKERHKFHLAYNISPLRLKTDTSTVKTTLVRVGGWGRMTNYIHN